MQQVMTNRPNTMTINRWKAVLERNREAGDFVYAVVTTGIFCRSHCPARRPKFENVAFFDTPDDARKAGYRACKRCRPDSHHRNSNDNTHKIHEACKAICESESALALNDLARRAGMSPYHFHRTFKAVTGTTPKAYGRSRRLQKLQHNLRNSDLSITDAIFDAGFNSSSRFYEQATALLGMTPTQYRKGGTQLNILFAVGECSLGAILVACTRKGVCAILLGDRADELVIDIQKYFPNATLTAGDSDYEKLVAYVIGFIDQPAQSLNLPLDIQGTAFQERVWSALRKIPPGATASYKQIAEQLGMAKAHRAVANACGSNKLAVAIPCHRIVRSDGSASGYRWGIERKQKLLTLEKQTAADSYTDHATLSDS